MNVRLISIYLCATIAISCFVGTFYYTHRYFGIQKTTIQNTTRELNHALDQSTNTLQENLSAIEDSVQKLTDELSNNDTTTLPLDALLKNQLKQTGILTPLGIIAAYQPFAHDADHRLWSLVYAIKNNQPTRLNLSYDYTLPTKQASVPTEWYNNVLTQGAHWEEAYFGAAQKSLIIVYSAPFFKHTDLKKQKIIGVISKSFNLYKLGTVVRELSVGNAGIGFALSTNGTNIAPLPQAMQQTHINELILQAKLKKSGTYPIIDQASGERAVILYRFIPNAKIVLGVYFLMSELLTSAEESLRKLVLLMLLMAVCTITSSIITFTLYLPTKKNIQLSCITISGVFFCATIIAWYLELNSQHATPNAQSIVLRTTMAKTILNQAAKTEAGKNTTTIKTGITINTIDYLAKNQVTLTGLVWQRYPLKIPTHVPREVLLPDIIKPFKKVLISRTQHFEEELYIWQFSGVSTLTPITPQLFPFDEQGINLSFEISPVQYPCALIPDFNSYKAISPHTLPGIRLQEKSPKFMLNKSFFNYQQKTEFYDIAPRLSGPLSTEPSLYFSIILSRTISDMLVLYLIPIAVALILLYIATGMLERNQLYLPKFIDFAASVFLTLTFIQPALRKATGSSITSYLEYYYMLIYSITCILLIIGMAYTRLQQNNLDTLHNHFFWIHHLLLPTTLSIIFLFSVLIFY